MECCENKKITIYKGFGTKWDNIDIILVSFDSEIDIDGFGAEFYIGDVVKTYQNVQDGFAINLTAQETETLPLGPTTGTLVLIDLENNKHPFSTELPFLVKDWEEGDIKLDGFNIVINSKIQTNSLVINANCGAKDPKEYSGYDPNKVQSLRNVMGEICWVDV